MLTFAPATMQDVPKIVELVNHAYSPVPDAPGWAGERSFQPDDRTSTTEVERLIECPATIVLVGCQDGLLTSCCSVTHQHPDTAYLGMFAVEPKKQSNGAGRQTMKYAEMFAQVRFGVTRVEIDVIEHHKQLFQWYTRLGYQTTGDRTLFPGSAEPTETWLIRLSKHLSESSNLPGGKIPWAPSTRL